VAVMAESAAAAAPLLTGRFQRAFAVACEVHAAQLRKGTRIPYLAHLLSVAALVLEHGGGEDAAIGGPLHDAVEDSADGTQMEACDKDRYRILTGPPRRSPRSAPAQSGSQPRAETACRCGW
jgi:(p)ppGpp synthase/HD superfamily hydrolase